MPKTDDADSRAVLSCDLGAVGERIGRLERGQRLTLVGVGPREVGDILRSGLSAGRRALLLAPTTRGDVGAVIDDLLDDLARIALALWPHWHCGTDGLSGNAAVPSSPWLRAASRLAGAGRTPRLRRIDRGVEIRHLLQVTGAEPLVLVTTVDLGSSANAAATIQVAEWCAAQGMAVVVAVPTSPPPVAPYDRILHGALRVVRDPEPVETRYIAPLGRVHGASAVEARIQAAILADAELAPLFAYNQIVETGVLGFRPRVDLLWAAGGIVIELDGPEHFFDPAYSADRHRDYELVVAGYLVVRLTNAQVTMDLERAIEKIRTVVRFRQSRAGSLPA